MTISTFRSLEQQAIRLYKERQQNKEINHRYASMETFGQEITKTLRHRNEPIPEVNKENKINFFA